MPNILIRSLVRSSFRLSSRDRATRRIRLELGRYLALADRLGEEQSRRSVRVPALAGVDEDMREWSFYMILEHNVIVNRTISALVESLARGEEPRTAGVVDPKKDVMPSANPGPEQVEAFRQSVEAYLALMADLPPLRGTQKTRHPSFGMFDAHSWHCMFGFHLVVHRRQAEVLEKLLHAGRLGTGDGKS
jgi:hypothetical protein